jgi:hypothetical protein
MDAVITITTYIFIRLALPVAIMLWVGSKLNQPHSSQIY